MTALIARENGLEVDEAAFEIEMEEQKKRSRNAAKLETGDWIDIRKIERTEFLGYDTISADVNIARFRKVSRKNKEFYQLVFDRTPFYGESGGQAGDSGYLMQNGEKTVIFDTQKENNLIVHLTNKLPENPGEMFNAVVDSEKRERTANNHTATHLLHEALREVLGTHVEQNGSMVDAEHLRFDFSHFSKMTDEDTERVEKIVNEKIRKNLVREENRKMPIDKAKEMGAMMLFGEKYGESVRVIKFGDSVELCGGTHVESTGHIGLFKIISESAIAAGVRRIEAITGEKAEEYVNNQIKTLRLIRDMVKGSGDIMSAVLNLLKENSELAGRVEVLIRERLKIIKASLKNKVFEVNGVNVISGLVDVDSSGMLKDLAFQLKNEIDNLFMVLGADIDGKPNITVMISENLVREKGLDASKIVREAGREIKGGGGGQPFYATAGGKEAAGIQNAINKALEHLRKK